MKRIHSFALYALVTPVITLGAGSVLALDPAGKDIDRQQQNAQRAEDSKHSTSRTAKGEQSKQHAARLDSQNRAYLESAPADGLHASNLIGTEVKATGDKKVGSVSDLIIDKDGQVVAAVIGVGGFLGMGEKDVAIDWDNIERSSASGEQELRIDATREDLHAAVKFEAEQTTPGTAQSDQSKQRDKQSDSQERGYMDSAPADSLHASNLIGANVKSTGDEKVGPVSDLILDKDGQVVAIVVGVGGFLGMGERDVAIGWDEVTRSGTSDELKLAIDVTREGLRSAPKFEQQTSQGDEDAGKVTTSDAQSDQDARQSTARTAQSDESKKDGGQSDSQKAAAAADGGSKRDHSGPQHKGYMDSAPANGLHASTLIGASVKTTGDEKVGPVSDLIIDEDGQIVAIVVGVGGFLGMGQTHVAIGWDDVAQSGTSDEPELRIDVTAEALRSAPKFELRD